MRPSVSPGEGVLRSVNTSGDPGSVLKVTRSYRLRASKPVPASRLIGFLRNFRRDLFVEALSSHAVQRYQREIEDWKFEGDEPWVVAGVAALALTKCYPVGGIPTPDDVRKVCGLYFQLERPNDPGHPLSFERLMVPELYRQALHQKWMLGEASRASLMLEGSSWPFEKRPVVMTPGWDEDVLGCAVQEFISAGVLLFAAVISGRRFPFDLDDSAVRVFDSFGGRKNFESIVRSQYVADLEVFQAERNAALEQLRQVYAKPWIAEPFTFNPLVKRPLIKGIVPSVAIAPAPQEVLRRASVEGIIYEGLRRHGADFTADAGHYFEGYIGRQLRTIGGARVFGEVRLVDRAGDRVTVDWMVDLGSSILLVECKVALPRRDVVEGWNTFADGHGQIANGREQIVYTFDSIRKGRPELAFLPSDVPIVGLVVTLGSFYAGNDESVVGPFERRDVPIAAVDAEFLETLVTLRLPDLQTFVRRMLESAKEGDVEPRDLCAGLEFRRNPLLKSAFASLPVMSGLDPSTG